MEHPDEAEEDIKNQERTADFISIKLSKKRKLGEQFNLPLSRHKFKTLLDDSEREHHLLDASSVRNDSFRNLDFASLPETDCSVLEGTLLNKSTVLESNARKSVINADLQIHDSVKYSIVRENRDGNIMFPSFGHGAKSISLQFNLDPGDERSLSCSTGYSCISESFKQIGSDDSCNDNKLCHPTVNQSSKLPNKKSCCSPHSSTTFAGLELSRDSMHSLARHTTKKRTPTDSDFLYVNLQDCMSNKDKLTQKSVLEHDHFDRYLIKDGVLGAEGNDIDLMAADIAETNFGGSSDSRIKSAIGKRHKSVNTTNGSWEFGSGSPKGSHIRAESELLASNADNASVEYGSSQNSPGCHSKGTASPWRQIGGSITSNEAYEEQDANYETYSDSQGLSNEISAEVNVPLPSYVLSSGRLSHKQEEHRGSRSPTIDQDFEQYFSMLML